MILYHLRHIIRRSEVCIMPASTICFKQERTIRRAWNKGIRLPYALMDSYLCLGSYQGTDFDVQIVDNTLCMMTHMLLTLEKRFSKYETMVKPLPGGKGVAAYDNLKEKNPLNNRKTAGCSGRTPND